MSFANFILLLVLSALFMVGCMADPLLFQIYPPAQVDYVSVIACLLFLSSVFVCAVSAALASLYIGMSSQH
jgi:hypothetical protein